MSESVTFTYVRIKSAIPLRSTVRPLTPQRVAFRACGSEADWLGGFVPRIYKIPDIIEHGYIVFKVGGSTPSLSTKSVILYDSKEGYKLDWIPALG